MLAVIKKDFEGLPILEITPDHVMPPFPLLLVLHGFWGAKEVNIDLAQRLAQQCGCRVAMFDAHLHGESQTGEYARRGKAVQAQDALEVIEVTVDRLSAVRSWYEHDESTDSTRTGVLGQSMGAMVVCDYLTRAESADLKAVICAMGTPVWRPAFERVTKWMPELAAWYDAARLDAIEKRQPLTGIISMPDVPLMMQVGDNDPLISPQECLLFRTTYQRTHPGRMPPSIRIYEGAGHDRYTETMAADAQLWIQANL